MNLKKAFPALFLLLLLGAAFSNDEPATGSDQKQTDTGDEANKAPAAAKGTPCFQKALIAVGLEGVPHAINESLKMCPGVTSSCCKVSDQVLMYEGWVDDGNEKYIKSRFEFYSQVWIFIIIILGVKDGSFGKMIFVLLMFDISSCSRYEYRFDQRFTIISYITVQISLIFPCL